MRFTTTTFLLFSAASVLVHAQIPSFLTSEFAKNEGNEELEVVYSGNKIVDGEKFAPEDVSEVPFFKLCDSCGISPGTNYMIMLLDVDATGEGKGETPQALHFLQTNFQPGTGGTDLVSEERPLVSYVPPNPERGTGKHRYVWLLFLQRSDVTASGLKGVPKGDDLAKFDVLKFIEDNGLESPEWGVQFVSEFGGETEAPISSAVQTFLTGTNSPTRASTTVDEPSETGSTTGTRRPTTLVTSTTASSAPTTSAPTSSAPTPTVPANSTSPASPSGTNTGPDGTGTAPQVFKGAWLAAIVAIASAVFAL